MDTDSTTLRLVLLGAGVLLILGVYLWSRRRGGARGEEFFRENQRGDLFDDQVGGGGEREVPLTGDPDRFWDDPSVTVGPVRVVQRAEPGEEPPLGPQAEPPAHTLAEEGAAVGPPRVESPRPEPRPAPPPRPAPAPRAARPAEPAPRPAAPSPKAPEVRDEDMIIALHLTAPKGMRFSGRAVMEAIIDTGLIYGDMDIFHRHVEQSTEALFSVANMLKPGSFDANDMSTFETPGLSFFMRLPGPMAGLKAFDEMYATARRLADTLGGDLRDQTRSVFSRQTAEHIRDQIRDFELRAHLKKSKG